MADRYEPRIVTVERIQRGTFRLYVPVDEDGNVIPNTDVMESLVHDEVDADDFSFGEDVTEVTIGDEKPDYVDAVEIESLEEKPSGASGMFVNAAGDAVWW